MKVSVIVPAYNEEFRAKPFLNELKNAMKPDWEVIFVDDGSTDNTSKVLQDFKIINKKVISYKKNHGKGFAVRQGIIKSSGSYIIFIDADGSIRPTQIYAMLGHLKKYDVVVGTRASKESKVKQSLLRKILAKFFNSYVNILYNTRINDNLCGFKGFRRNLAKKLFSDMISERWIFDVELLYKTRKLGLKVYEMPIEWNYKRDSKMGVFDPFKIALQLLFLRLKLSHLK